MRELQFRIHSPKEKGINMPASKHTKKATTPKLKRQWQHVRDSMEERGYSAGRAVRSANAVVKRQTQRNKRKSGRTRSRS